MTLMRPLAIDPCHPSFAGHFPGHPVVPGAVLLDHALAAIAHALSVDAAGAHRCAIRHAKFLSPVRPGEALRLEAEGEVEAVALRIFAGDPERLAVSGVAGWRTTARDPHDASD